MASDNSSITLTINTYNGSHHKNSSSESMATMQQSRKPAPLHPLATSRANSIANYSYPRYDDSTSRCSSAQALWSPSSTISTASTTPLDLDVSSPPGLIDDRTDSEASGDDEHHYQAHTAELFNTFWKTPRYQTHPHSQHPQQPQQQQQKGKTTVERSLLCEQEDGEISPLQKYPALIPSPKIPAEPHRSGQDLELIPSRQAWPLSNHRPDAVPAPLRIAKKPGPEFPPRTCSRLSTQTQTQRPSKQPSTTTATSPTTITATTLTTTVQQQSLPRRTTPPRARHQEQRQGSCPNPTFVPWSPIYASHTEAHRSATHIPLSPVTQSKPPTSSTPLTRTVRPYKSTNYLNPGHSTNTKSSKPTSILKPPPSEPEPKPEVQPEEPRSVFEYDDDSDSDSPSTGGISPTLSFFRFHKRGESRRSANKSISHQASHSISEQDHSQQPQQQRRSRPRRGSSITAVETPISPLQLRRDAEHKHKKYKQERNKDHMEHDAHGRDRKQSLDMASFAFPAGVKTRQSAVLSRMLGRRKR